MDIALTAERYMESNNQVMNDLRVIFTNFVFRQLEG